MGRDLEEKVERSGARGGKGQSTGGGSERRKLK